MEINKNSKRRTVSGGGGEGGGKEKKTWNERNTRLIDSRAFLAASIIEKKTDRDENRGKRRTRNATIYVELPVERVETRETRFPRGVNRGT